MSLNSPVIVHKNKETIDNMVISEEQNDKNKIHSSENKTTARNLLTDLINKKMSKEDPGKSDGPSYGGDEIDARHFLTNIDHGLPSKYPNSSFDKGVRILNEDFVGFIMKETKDKIVVFRNYVQRYDIPKSKTYEVEGNIILNMNGKEFATYETDIYTSLPK